MFLAAAITAGSQQLAELQSFVPFKEPHPLNRSYTIFGAVTLLGFTTSEVFSPTTLTDLSNGFLFCTSRLPPKRHALYSRVFLLQDWMDLRLPTPLVSFAFSFFQTTQGFS
jgi:hypothetical protein